MPTYDYRCEQCGQVFEAKRRFSEDASSAPCPDDGTPGVRQFSPPMDVFVTGKGYNTPGVPPPMAGGSPGGGGGHSHGPGGHTHGPGEHTH
jgi:putative FmdB family regulatory protein